MQLVDSFVLRPIRKKPDSGFLADGSLNNLIRHSFFPHWPRASPSTFPDLALRKKKKGAWSQVNLGPDFGSFHRVNFSTGKSGAVLPV